MHEPEVKFEEDDVTLLKICTSKYLLQVSTQQGWDTVDTFTNFNIAIEAAEELVSYKLKQKEAK